MTRTTKYVLLAALAAALAGGTASMADPNTDAIKNRQQAMKHIAGAMQKLAAIVKKEAPFDAGVVKDNAATIEETLGEASAFFPEGSDKGDVETRAKPEIWSHYEDFMKKLEAAEDDAAALQSVTVESELLPALGKLGDACRACHQTYRRPEE